MMLRVRFRIIALFCVLIMGCGQKKVTPGIAVAMPSDSLIAPLKMILILADIHVVEAAMHTDKRTGPATTTGSEFYYNGIFRKYHISPARYEQNLSHYRQNPGEFAKMYEQVVGIIESRQKKFPSTE
jgi:hypothetical protein